jgi:hypothetical protein
MSSTRYYIVGDHDVWVIQGASPERTQCTDRNNAMALAIRVAQKLGMRGQRAHVCVFDDDGCFRPRWTFNRGRHVRRRVSNA